MTFEGTPVHLLGGLVCDATTSPESVDTNALLIAADAFLSLVKPGDHKREETTAARAMAHAAFGWALFGGDESHLRLQNATRSWWMLTHLARSAEKLPG